MKYCVCAAFVVLLVLPACSSKTATGAIPSDGFPAPDKELVWNVAAQVLRDGGYTPDSMSSSQQTWTILTHWQHSMQPFSKLGYRERAKVVIHDVCDRRDYYYTETQIIRQCNDDVRSPSSRICADWGDESRVPEKECLINNRIEMHFLPGCVSPQFRERYSMPCAERGRVPIGAIKQREAQKKQPTAPSFPSSTPSSQPSR